MWDFLPMERDEYVSAEDDAIRVEQARERARARGANPSDGICPVCDMTLSECGGEKAHDREEEPDEGPEICYECGRLSDGCICSTQPLEQPRQQDFESAEGPEFAQEYESPEDVYAEQEAGEDW